MTDCTAKTAKQAASALERLPVTAIRRGHDGVIETLRHAASVLRDLTQENLKLRKLCNGKPAAANITYGWSVDGPSEDVAERIMDMLKGKSQVYVLRTGAVRVVLDGKPQPKGGLLVGTYDFGADRDQLCADIAITRGEVGCAAA